MPSQGDEVLFYPDRDVGISRSAPSSGQQALIHGRNVSRGESSTPSTNDSALMVDENVAQIRTRKGTIYASTDSEKVYAINAFDLSTVATSNVLTANEFPNPIEYVNGEIITALDNTTEAYKLSTPDLSVVVDDPNFGEYHLSSTQFNGRVFFAGDDVIGEVDPSNLDILNSKSITGTAYWHLDNYDGDILAGFTDATGNTAQNKIQRLDPDTFNIIDEYVFSTTEIRPEPEPINNTICISQFSQDGVIQIDPATFNQIDSFTNMSNFRGMHAYNGYLYVSWEAGPNYYTRLDKVDPATMTSVEHKKYDNHANNKDGYEEILGLNGYIYGTTGDRLYKTDPDTLDIVRKNAPGFNRINNMVGV